MTLVRRRGWLAHKGQEASISPLLSNKSENEDYKNSLGLNKSGSSKASAGPETPAGSAQNPPPLQDPDTNC